MDRRAFLTGTLGLLGTPLRVKAQPPTVPRIGFLRFASPQPRQFEAFRDGLRALGYIEGQTIAIEQRYAEGVRDRFPGLAAELVRLKVDLLVVDGFPEAAKSVTGTIPVIFTLVGDPVAQGLVASLARPGGNLTGAHLVRDRTGRKAAGAAQGSGPHGLPRGGAGEPDQFRHPVHVARDGRGGPHTGSPASDI